MADRRLSKRLLFRKKFKYGVCNPKFNGLTHNISEDGIGIKTNKPLMPVAQIILDIFLGEDILRLTGVVRWVSDDLPDTNSRMGIKITSHHEKIKDLYKKLPSINIH